MTGAPPALALANRERALAGSWAHAGQAGSDPTRATLYQQTEAATLADLPATPLLTEHHAAVLTPGPQGFNLTPWGALDLATVSLPA